MTFRRRCRKMAAALAVLAVGVLAARPFAEPRLTLTFDSVFHYYNLIEIDQLFREGIFFTRWFPFKISRFGAPFFQYYPPLAYYTAGPLVFLGLEPLAALRLAWAAMLVAGAAGAYLWVRDALGRGPGLVAAAAYACAPYTLFNAYFRGGFTEQCALMLMPLALWGLARLGTTGRARYLAVGSLACGGIVVSHSLTALLFSPALLLYALALTLGQEGAAARRRVALRLGAAVLLGITLAAFFWLPVLAERSAVRSELAYGSSALDYHRHFIGFGALFDRPFTTRLRPALSSVAVGLGLFGLLKTGWDGLAGRDDPSPTVVRDSALVWFAALVTLACTVMTLPALEGVWDAIPLLRFFQFPYRFLAAALPFLAYLAGAGLHGLDRIVAVLPLPGRLAPLVRRAARAALLLAALALLTGHAWKLPRSVGYYRPLPEIDVAFVMQKGRETTSVVGEFPTMFIPATVEEMPPVELLAQDGPERLDGDVLPEGATVVESVYTPLRYDLTFSSPEPFRACFRTFYFPGWQARIDGQPADVRPTSPHGLVSVDVPAGEHRLEVWFGSTPVRTLADGLSACGLGALVGIACLRGSPERKSG